MCISKSIRTEQEIKVAVHHLYFIMVLSCVGVISSTLIFAVSPNRFTFCGAASVALLSAALAVWSSVKTNDVKFVDVDQMLEISQKVEPFLCIKESFCKIVAVRPLLTVIEYRFLENMVCEASKRRDASMWELKRRSICS